MSTLIMKFGGASVGSADSLDNVLNIVAGEHGHWSRLLLVVSALDGVTDQLIEASRLAQLDDRRGYRRIVAKVRQRHLTLVEQLPFESVEINTLTADIDRFLFDMLNACQQMADNSGESDVRDTLTDQVTGVGEMLASRIVAALLRQHELRSVAIDATDVIVTDDVHGNATPNLDKTRERVAQTLLPMLDRNIVPVLTGYIGITETGKQTTLGRGGSDYTASILAVCAGAKEVWIWSHVDGIMSTDPDQLSEARVIPELGYDEMAELAYFGAKILHPRMVGPLQQHNIPLRVKNFSKPSGAGTLVFGKPRYTERIKAVTAIRGLVMQGDVNKPIGAIAELVDSIIGNAAGIKPELMFSAQTSRNGLLCFVVPTTSGEGEEFIHEFQTRLEEQIVDMDDWKTWHVKPVRIVTAVGQTVGNAQIAAQILQVMGNVPVIAFSQGQTRCSLSLVVDSENYAYALERIHSLTRIKNG